MDNVKLTPAPNHKNLTEYLEMLASYGDSLPPTMVITYHQEVSLGDGSHSNGLIHHVDQPISEPFCIIGDRARMTVPALIKLVQRMGDGELDIAKELERLSGGKVALSTLKLGSELAAMGIVSGTASALADELSQAIKQLVPSTPIPKFQPAKSGHPNERTSKGSRRRNRSERWR